MNTVERYICVMAIIYATCYAPMYFSKTQDTSVDSTLLVTLEVARNHRNFRCARSWVAILLASLIFINSRRRQTKHTLANSMLCSSVVKAFYIPKRGTEIDEDLLCQNMSKNRSNVRILTSTTTYTHSLYIIDYILLVHVYCIQQSLF